MFDISYILRAIYDIYFTHAEEGYGMGVTVMTVFTTTCIDLIPICSILYFHARNFKVIQFGTLDYKSASASFVSQLDHMTTNSNDQPLVRGSRDITGHLIESNAASIVKVKVTAATSERT